MARKPTQPKRSPAKPTPSKAQPSQTQAKPSPAFDPQRFLSTIDGGKTLLVTKKNQTLFSQGDAADAVFYIQSGRVKLSVLSGQGKEAVIAILEQGSFLGEPCLAGQPLRLATATALDASTIVRIEKDAIIRVLHDEPAFAELFTSYLLARNIRIQEDLVNHLFNSNEKRLARVLLLLAHFGKERTPEPIIPKISQGMLAEMIGTTRSRVGFFINTFKTLGLIFTVPSSRSSSTTRVPSSG